MGGGEGGGGALSGKGVRVDVNGEEMGDVGYGGCKPRIKGIDKCK